jgi:hypothetical protein
MDIGINQTHLLERELAPFAKEIVRTLGLPLADSGRGDV